MSCCIIVFSITLLPISFLFFFFNDTATTEIYTLSLHDALPISNSRVRPARSAGLGALPWHTRSRSRQSRRSDRKSTRLNSSHLVISYAVFCLKKKKNTKYISSLITDTNIYLSRSRSTNQLSRTH